jgi:S1-C subfamily serine protease
MPFLWRSIVSGYISRSNSDPGICIDGLGNLFVAVPLFPQSLDLVADHTEPLHKQLRRFHDLKQDTGVLVLDVNAGSPAAVAGLREGDVLLDMDGAVLEGADSLFSHLTESAAGKAATVRVLHGHDVVRVVVVPRMVEE